MLATLAIWSARMLVWYPKFATCLTITLSVENTPVLLGESFLRWGVLLTCAGFCWIYSWTVSLCRLRSVLSSIFSMDASSLSSRTILVIGSALSPLSALDSALASDIWWCHRILSIQHNWSVPTRKFCDIPFSNKTVVQQLCSPLQYTGKFHSIKVLYSYGRVSPKLEELQLDDRNEDQ